jgi:hypothetical protein
LLLCQLNCSVLLCWLLLLLLRWLLLAVVLRLLLLLLQGAHSHSHPSKLQCLRLLAGPYHSTCRRLHMLLLTYVLLLLLLLDLLLLLQLLRAQRLCCWHLLLQCLQALVVLQPWSHGLGRRRCSC